ncbi:flagellar motor switch protein FliN [Halomonas huangheensis]|uniref:Flagellar motor switch protein FliN n=1 Tax=Halomonas huangheensis TaxID=1178482 RepID=W1N6K5_9GAMM|nr:flagellar motor switch protein FliN [Halomonas huangheensis]ALM54240.1 flagellar motor switch protein FliN [Halomonas huangheensis]ERL50786.1 hypothetical protein BJB45_19515 [Halomonas huangheensis]
MTDPKKPDAPVGEDDWEAAMSEQQDDSTESAEDDPWAAALAEQQQAEDSTDDVGSDETDTASATRNAGESVFRPLAGNASEVGQRDLEMIMDIPVKLTVELGRTRLTIKQLLELAQGSVIELDGLAGEPMDILINGYLIAQGEVVVVEDRYGIRITEIITPSERVKKLNR